MSPERYRSRPSHPAARALARMAAIAGQALRDERTRRDLTLRDCAGRAGVSAALVQKLESGGSVSLEAYARVATALELRPELILGSPRRPTGIRAADPVHSAMGELEAAHLRKLGSQVAIDEPYQHFQFAGRADLVAWDLEARALLHLENRTRFPDIQDALGSYSAKRAYLPKVLADRLGISRTGWRVVTHAIVALWSAEVLHTLRVRGETFRSACPDPLDDFEDWWAGRIPIGRRPTSTLVILDPSPGRRAAFAGLAALPTLRPRYRGYADAAVRLGSVLRGD
jgi:transcriptional regulator with XRE-family HTH domain